MAGWRRGETEVSVQASPGGEGYGDRQLTVVPPVDRGIRRMARPACAERPVNTNRETTCSGTSGNS